jgi:hypothetical protein
LGYTCSTVTIAIDNESALDFEKKEFKPSLLPNTFYAGIGTEFPTLSILSISLPFNFDAFPKMDVGYNFYNAGKGNETSITIKNWSISFGLNFFKRR